MRNSRHPIALQLEQRVGGAPRLLATVMALPLIDGIFAALVLAGVLSTVGGILQVGLLVFGGSATAAVILAELGDNPRGHLRSIALVGILVIVLAAVEAAIAPTIESVLRLAIFERFAALVIAAVAATTASARIGDILPRPAVIVALGLLASLDLHDAALVVTLDWGLVLRAVAAASVGVAFALAVAALAPVLRSIVDIDRFRFGSAVALGVLPLSILGLAPGNAPLAVFGVALLLAYDPSGDAPSSTLAARDTVTSAVPDGAGSEISPANGDDPESERDDPTDTWGSSERAPWL